MFLPPEGRTMKFMTAADWSVGLNAMSSDSLSDAYVMARIGGDLQRVYKDVLEEPLPEHLAVILERLDKSEVPDGPT